MGIDSARPYTLINLGFYIFMSPLKPHTAARTIIGTSRDPPRHCLACPAREVAYPRGVVADQRFCVLVHLVHVNQDRVWARCTSWAPFAGPGAPLRGPRTWRALLRN